MGKLYLDDGAVKAITEGRKSLLPAGIIKVEGEFTAGDAVQLCDRNLREIARGLVNYSSQELDKVKGLRSAKIAHILGYNASDTAINRDNLVVNE